MNRFVSVAALAAAAFVCACGGGGTATGGGTDGGVGSTCNTANPGDGGTCTDPPGGASCNAVQNCGPVVQETQVASSAPSAAGGTPVDGTYFLTSRTIYTGTGGATGGTGQFRKSTVVISGGNVAQIVSRTDNCGDDRMTLSVSHTGTTLTSTATCPTNCPGCDGSSPYTATSSQLLVFEPQANVTIETYVKQ